MRIGFVRTWFLIVKRSEHKNKLQNDCAYREAPKYTSGLSAFVFPALSPTNETA